MKIKVCRLCESKKFFNLLNLGKLSYTGKFAKKFSENIPKATVAIIMCKKCRLVQLDRSFNPKYLYSKDYGYRTGINKTMTEHVKKVVISATNKVKLKKNDYVLDIARIGLAAEMLGSTQEVFDRILEYLKQREQFGVLIGSFQGLQHRAANMYSEIELCKSVVRAALAALDNKNADRVEIAELASIAKAKFHVIGNRRSA